MVDENKSWQFQPGKSGNPKGRRRGSRSKVLVALEALGEGEVEAIVKTMIEKAKEGDAAAAKTILDRVWPPRKGARLQFDLPLHPSGTPFQLEVWGALLAIPYGETVSYADIARRIRRPRAVRAVGAANGANPLSIIVPCHRVIGSHGDLTGYGGGLPAKRWLLAHERKYAPVPALTLTA